MAWLLRLVLGIPSWKFGIKVSRTFVACHRPGDMSKGGTNIKANLETSHNRRSLVWFDKFDIYYIYIKCICVCMYTFIYINIFLFMHLYTYICTCKYTARVHIRIPASCSHTHTLSACFGWYGSLCSRRWLGPSRYAVRHSKNVKCILGLPLCYLHAVKPSWMLSNGSSYSNLE